jgi:segregation and condensation protein B
MSLTTEIEALLFASDQPLSTGRLAEVLDELPRAEIDAALRELAAICEAPERAFRLVAVAGGWQLATKPEYSSLIRRLFTGKRRVRLTKAALESLAIIAYKQPTTRPEIDAIRGVSSGGVIETLLERSLVRIAGRAEGIGRPLLYATTPEFLQYLGLNRIEDLPSLEELEAMLAEREAAARAADDEEMAALAAAAQDEAPAAADEDGSAPAPDVIAAARIEARLREENLPTLEELDEELRERTSRVTDAAARAAAERARHLAEASPGTGAATLDGPQLPEELATAEAEAPQPQAAAAELAGLAPEPVGEEMPPEQPAGEASPPNATAGSCD